MNPNSEPFDSLLSDIWEPAFWPPHLIDKASAWWTHVPFAFWLVSTVCPRQLVELGTHNGVSYSAFCEAVSRRKLSTKCFAVDTWIGDEHAGHYSEEVYHDFRAFHDRHYSAFSELLRMSFDEALTYITDGSIDLLHIDGLHTYDAVRHDFESWLPKLSNRGVVLLHDTNLRERNFGVFRYFEQLGTEYPTFEFFHGCGLGIVCIGEKSPAAIRQLCAIGNTAEGAILRARFSHLGERWLCANQQQMKADSAAAQMGVTLELSTEIAPTIPSESSSGQTHEDNLTEQLNQAKEQLNHCLTLNANLEAEKLHLADFAKDLEKELKDAHSRLSSEVQYKEIAKRYEALYDDPAIRTSSKIKRRLRSLAAKLNLGSTTIFDIQQAEIVRRSIHFDRIWYNATYPDVAKSGIDPAHHYVRFGAKEGRDPSSTFSSSAYLASNPDIATTRLNPLVHYIQSAASKTND